MTECWLKPNRRPTYVALTLGVCAVLAGGVGFALAWRGGSTVGTVISGVLLGMAMCWCAVCWGILSRARVSYRDEHLFVHDGSQAPIAIPIDVVEAFFLGSGPAISDESSDTGPRSANVVIRIAEAAKKWHEGKLSPVIGKWSEGYIVLRGTWCEPIGHERLNQINHRLAEVHRKRRNMDTTSAQVTA